MFVDIKNSKTTSATNPAFKAGLHIRHYCSRLFCLLSTKKLNVLVLGNIASFIANIKACANQPLPISQDWLRPIRPVSGIKKGYFYYYKLFG
jgi:hypothetical protein